MRLNQIVCMMVVLTGHVNLVLACIFASLGLTGLVLEFVIRAQVNRHLPPRERVSIYSLQYISVWLGSNGLIARHKRLYPHSRLADSFPVIWVLFFVTFFGLAVYAKFR